MLMSMPDLAIVAEGDTPAGERWYLRAGGSPDDYYTMLETAHPDGRRDSGGMGGPVLYPGQLLNVYTGRASPRLLRVIVRADPRVALLRFQSELGEACEMPPVAESAALGVAFFAILLPWTTGIASLQALDADGRILPS